MRPLFTLHRVDCGFRRDIPVRLLTTYGPMIAGSYTIWPALFTSVGPPPTNTPTGWEAPSGTSWTFEVEESWGGRIWPVICIAAVLGTGQLANLDRSSAPTATFPTLPSPARGSAQLARATADLNVIQKLVPVCRRALCELLRARSQIIKSADAACPPLSAEFNLQENIDHCAQGSSVSFNLS